MTDFRLDPARLAGLDPDDAAAHWLLMRDRGLSPSEEIRFAAWLRASDGNAAAWSRAEELWASFDAEPDVLLDAMRKAALQARPDARPQITRALIAASAAGLIAVAGLGGWRWLGMMTPGAAPSRQVTEGPASRPDYATGVGGRLDVTLPDGTRVTLDSASAMDVDYTPTRRAVRFLRGQAYFAVAHDAHHPFVVDAAGHGVTAVGTEFDVCIGQRAMSVVVSKGSVQVSQASEAAPVVPVSRGQKFRAAPGAPGVVVAVDLDQALAWRSGYLDFRDEPLVAAVDEMNRHGGPPVSVGDSRARSLKVSGRFRIGDPVRFARALAEVYPLRIDDSGGGVVIVRR